MNNADLAANAQQREWLNGCITTVQGMVTELERQAEAWDRLLLDLEDRTGEGDQALVRSFAAKAREQARLGQELIS